MRASFSFFGVFLSFLCDPGHGNRGTFGCADRGICQAFCSFCVNTTAQACYEFLVNSWCKYQFDEAMESLNSTDWCSWERIKSPYNNFTVCTETVAECLLLPWPNQFVEQIFVDIHATYFQECTREAPSDPPPSIVLALVMTPICLIPVMVVLVVFKTKNGDRRTVSHPGKVSFPMNMHLAVSRFE